MQNSVGQYSYQQPQTMYSMPSQTNLPAVQPVVDNQMQSSQIQPAAQSYMPSEQMQYVQPAPVQTQGYQSNPMSAQGYQVPNYSGVNIQIFNPSVTPPGATPPVYNVNAPSYAMGNNQPACYPPNYYTGQFGPNANDANANASASASTSQETKKTEKRNIVELTDDYIRNLENYLNSQDKEIRYMGAKEVVARLEEDDSRKDDKALNALVNKMLQDPYDKVRFIALAALQNRMVTGDDFTVGVLQNMQNQSSGYGEDALLASEILLKMSGNQVEKEFEVKNSSTKETKTSSSESSSK